MMWIIIATVIATITILLLKDTHVTEYRKYYNGGIGKYKIEEESDIRMTVGWAILIILVSLIPIVNIVLFLIFITWYLVHALILPKGDSYGFYKFSLHGSNFLTKAVKGIKKILNKPL